jgi:hypothetical protein
LSSVMQSEKAVTLTGNAQAMMNIFSNIVVSWIWIRQASKAEQLLAQTSDTQKQDFYRGKIQAAKYFIAWELPTILRDIQLLKDNDDVCTSVQAEWF